MELDKGKSSIKPYVIVLIIAVGLLLFIASISYKQQKSLKNSAHLVSHTIDINMKINELFSYYTLMKSQELSYMISRDSSYLEHIKEYKFKSEKSIANLYALTIDNKEQQKNLKNLSSLKDDLFKSLESINAIYSEEFISYNDLNVKIKEIDLISKKIKTLKESMIAEEERLLIERKKEYATDIWFTPVTSLFIVLFSLIVFIISFYKINNDRKQRSVMGAFLRNILKSTENVISHFEPVRNEDGKIIDFEIIYTNEQIENVTGDKAANILGKNISEVYPFHMKNGVFEMYVDSVINNRPNHYEKEYTFNGKKMSFHSTVINLEDSITVTSRNNTKEIESEKRLKHLNDELAFRNSILQNVKKIAKIGSYQWNMDTDVMEFSDNFYLLLGYEPNEFKSSSKKFLSFIHPNDLRKVKKRIIKAKNKKVFSDHTYRVIDKKGKIIYLNSTGHFIDKDNEIVLLGVLQDVSRRIKNELKLKDNNLALKRSNAELESFNRVASHDLQEPLRKIQIFISRIYDGEINNLTEKGQTYFNKINDSASRMQSLIHHLLIYSRVNKTDKTFKKVDLNVIIKKVKEDLIERIEENNVEIISSKLPIVNGVSFQIEQLFNNIISNAIKYRKADVSPIINLTSSISTYNAKRTNDPTDNKKYLKISVNDNGIGFDQEHSKKIFELFQRLHNQNEYSGTGIGLAICKKIIENHKGFIVADSTPNEGTTFHIYFPTIK